MRTPKYGRMDRGEYDRMCESIRRSGASSYSKQQQLAAARLLTDFPGSDPRLRAAVRPLTDYEISGLRWDDSVDDGAEEFEAEFAGLFPPRTAAEVERRAEARHRARLTASAHRAGHEITDDEADALFPPEPS